ncbi:MAG TPA: immunoglobulin domain-containing protein [Acidobacteriota bacterium]|nr:immunoglobulin domain-containing protein [Acidobacteriota bacterium]
MSGQRVFVALICAALVLPSIGAGQDLRTQATPGQTKVDISIALKVAGQPYNFSGKARSTHAPVASIYGTNAQQWQVEHNEDGRSVSLTFWRPTAGSGDMFTLRCKINGKSYLVRTVKTSGGGTIQGSGKVTFTPSKPGGTFTIDATTADGLTITGTIKCSAFSAPVDEGG